MANVFIYPIEDETAKSRYGAAVEKGVDLETVSPWIRDEIQVENLRRCYPDGKCYAWGVQEKGDNLSTWNAMAPEDLVLGYRNGSIVSAATVLMKISNPSLAERLWGRTAGEALGLMCFTDKPHVGEVPIVEQMEGYLDREYSRFTRLSPDKCQTILNAFGSLDIFVRLGLRYDFPFNFRHSE
jgi:hypothetical protein